MFWQHNKMAWVMVSLFLNWLHHYIPEVKKYLEDKVKVIQGPSYWKYTLIYKGDHVEVLFLSSNTMSVLRPVDQGIMTVTYTCLIFTRICAARDCNIMDLRNIFTITETRDSTCWTALLCGRWLQGPPNNQWRIKFWRCLGNLWERLLWDLRNLYWQRLRRTVEFDRSSWRKQDPSVTVHTTEVHSFSLGPNFDDYGVWAFNGIKSNVSQQT